ncbi:MAG: energy transducer TonB [Phenylobacterium sp.]|uniref:energy transducer TonB n=1 Tax=Phenylobacterium sp. TaxID=1871053 RepID=UPI001825E304|nr:energy transducer TonB [Phenylobacterium sp.]MBA4792186.1 energy transducer TonB [Phenylobacterium sp.]
MTRTGLILCALLLAAGGAQARQSVTPDAELDTLPDWLRMPTPQDLHAVAPAEAIRKGVGGRATLVCLVSRQGALFDCAVESETPAGMGFGAAAIALTPQLLMKPGTKNGEPVVSRTHIPFDFTGLERGMSGRYARVPPPVSRYFIGQPTWTEAPTYAEAVAVYPEKAATRRVGGSATVKCRIDADRRLKTCQTINEEPRGFGFARAARSLSEDFEIAPLAPGSELDLEALETQYMVTFDPLMLDGEARVTGRPTWTALPSAASMAGAFPAAAQVAGVASGRVIMDCRVGEGGTVEDCRVASEDPAGYGFGPAALSLTPGFRMSVWTMEGLPTVGGRITIPLRYQNPTAEAPPAAPPAAP